MDGLQRKFKLLRLPLHGPQEQTQLALVGLFVHNLRNVLNERAAFVQIQPEVVLENELEILVERVDTVRAVHGEHDEVLRGIENGLQLGALGFGPELVLPHVCDVEVNATHPCRLAGVVFLHRRPPEHGECLAIGRHKFSLLPGALDRLDPTLPPLRQSLNDVVHRTLRQFRFRIPQQVVERRVGVGEKSLVVQRENGVVRVVQNAPVTLFAGKQFLLGNLGFGDVSAHGHGPQGFVVVPPKNRHRQVHREHVPVQTLSFRFTREIELLQQRVADVVCLVFVGHKIPEAVLRGFVAHVQPKLHGKRVVVLRQIPLGIEGHNHVNRRFDDGPVEALGVGQHLLGFLVSLDFLLQQQIRLFGQRRTHLLTNQGHPGSKVCQRDLDRRRSVVKGQGHPDAYFHEFLVRRGQTHLPVGRSIALLHQPNVLFQHRLVVLVKQGHKLLVIHLVLQPNANQIEDPRVGVLHLSFHQQKQPHGTCFHKHPESLLRLKQVQLGALPFGDVVHHQHRLVGGGIHRTRRLEVNGPSLLGDSLKLHPGSRILSGAQSLPIPRIDHGEDVFPNGQFLPAKQNGELLIRIHHLGAFQEGNSLHGVPGQRPEALLAVPDHRLVQHAFADVANLNEVGPIANRHSFPLAVEQRASLTAHLATHFGGTSLKQLLKLRFEKPSFVAFQHEQPLPQRPHILHPCLLGRPVQHATGL